MTADERPTIKPIPPDNARQRAWLIGIAVVAVAVIVGVLLLWRASLRPGTEREEAKRYEPAQETTAEPLPSPAVVPTVTPEPTATPSAEPTQPVQPARVVFRLGSTIYVANPDGSGASPVGRVATGPYALSPDGRTVAVVSAGKLLFLDVNTGKSRPGGDASEQRPAWLPNSSAILVVRSAESTSDTRGEVWKVDAEKPDDAKRLTSGTELSVSPDGRTIAVLTSVESGARRAYASRDGGRFRRLSVVGVPTAVAAGNVRVYVGTVNSSGTAAVYSVARDGSDSRRMFGGPTVDSPSTWGMFFLSPDGRSLALCAVGDDEFSRLSIVTIADATEVRVNPRRDGYPLYWSADGSRLYFVEGNAYQGEPTVLQSVGRNGADSSPVVTGATR